MSNEQIRTTLLGADDIVGLMKEIAEFLHEEANEGRLPTAVSHATAPDGTWTAVVLTASNVVEGGVAGASLRFVGEGDPEPE